MTALKKLRILDFTQMMTGSMATMLLADFGADVIKVESPDGDPFRKSGEATLGGDGVFFLSLNRNKRGIVVDLKTPEGKAVIKELAAGADVVVENFRPGMADRLGIGYEELKAANPGLIYCSISGFGKTGPDRDRPALDQVIQAESGLMQLTGTEHSGPLKTGFPFSDLVTALMATIGILNAVVARYESGIGQRIDLSMMDSTIFSLVPRDIYYDVKKKAPPRMGNEHWDIVPNNTYPTRDGRDIMVITINDKFWGVLVEALGVSGMAADPRFATKSARLQHRREVDEALTEAFRQKTLSEWEPILKKAGAIYGVVRDWNEVFEDPKVVSDLIRHVEHPAAGTFKVVNNPLQFSETPTSIRRPPPRLGEHTESILSALSHAWEVRR